MGKNIVVFSDGTGQKGGVGTNTNVYRLFNMIEDRSSNQIAYYDPGLGTDWRKISGSIAGNGISDNILQCYQFIFENYESGDNIYLFGFSRGAATVRSLSSFIHLFGVLPKSRLDLIEQAFKIYKIKNTKKRNQKAAEFIDKHHTMWVNVTFLGVWDTVAALGLPNKLLSAFLNLFVPHSFHSFDLSESVRCARQALAIDDQRKTFHPLIWNPVTEIDRLKQVWFAGVHTDVGGGYKEDDLSYFSLNWMVKEACGKGLRVYENAPAYQKLQQLEENADGVMHDEQSSFIGRLFKRATRSWNKDFGVPVIHESVLKRTLNDKNEPSSYTPWILSFVKEGNYKIEKT